MSELGRILDLSQYKKEKCLGKGSFGEVYEITEKSTGALFAAKISINPTSTSSDEIIHNLLREVNINASVRHASIIHFVGFNPKNFENEDYPVIVTELAANGSLEHVIDLESKGLSIEGWDETKKLITIFGIASGMSFLHSNGILHRDLKLENILIDERLFPKISDFGLSKIKKDDGFASSTQSIANLKGTPSYLAPEIIEDYSYTKAGDVYSFGIIVFEILTTERAFSDLTFIQLLNAVVRGERPTIDKTVPEVYRQLIERCWSQEPEKRPTFDQIVNELQHGEFISPMIDNDSYQEYIEYVKEFKTKYEKDRKIIKFEDVVRNHKSQTFQKVSIVGITKLFDSKRILPVSKYEELNESCQKLVDESDNNPDKQYTVGKYMIEQKKGFEHLINYGIKYLERSNDGGCIDAALYLSKMYQEGVLVTKNIKKAKTYLLNYIDEDDARLCNELARILLNENSISEARVYYEKGAIMFDPESMFNYGLMLINGEGGECNIDEGLRYLNLSKNHSFESSCKYLKIYDHLTNKRSFSILQPEVKFFFVNQIYENNKDKSVGEMKIAEKIKLINQNIEDFFEKNVLLKDEFINTLNLFSDVLIEINFPTKNSSFLSKFMEIQSKFNSKFDIHVFVNKNTNVIYDFSFKKFFTLTEITTPSSVTRIGSNAFDECTSLKKVTIEAPSSLSSIESFAFMCCTSLTEIAIPSPVTKIGSFAFNECTSLAKITFETPSSFTSIKEYAFFKCTSLTEIAIPSSVTEIGKNAFSKCASLTKVTIDAPSSLTSIKEDAFEYCTSLTEITIPSSVTRIDKNAFSDCKSLTKVKIETPSSLTSIKEDAFYQCTSLTEIAIPSSVTEIGKNAFSKCASLTKVKIETPSSLSSIKEYAFYQCTSLTEIAIQSSITEIGENAFYKCASLTRITIPSSVTEIGKNAFFKCTSLTKVKIETPSSLSSIKEDAFNECKLITKITIPSSVTEIGENAFFKCTSLAKVKIETPSSLSSIKTYAFNDCTSLTEITIPSSVTEIGENAFSDCKSLTKVKIETPSSLTSIKKYAFNDCKLLTEITIPPSVTEIGENAFGYCTSLTKVTIETPSSLTSIKEDAFNNCSSLTEITIPSSVNGIGENAFMDCKSLTQVTIETPSSLTSIGDKAFSCCESLFPFNLPPSVTSIGKDIFIGCKEYSCNIQ